MSSICVKEDYYKLIVLNSETMKVLTRLDLGIFHFWLVDFPHIMLVSYIRVCLIICHYFYVLWFIGTLKLELLLFI